MDRSNFKYIEVVLGAFSKLEKSAINLAMPVCMSAWNHPGVTGRILMNFGIKVFYEDVSRRFKSH